MGGERGGKDSDVILQLAKESGVAFLTTDDPPDNVPRRSLWRIMRERLVIPSRIMRPTS